MLLFIDPLSIDHLNFFRADEVEYKTKIGQSFPLIIAAPLVFFFLPSDARDIDQQYSINRDNGTII